jgi:hypothetical protein
VTDPTSPTPADETPHGEAPPPPTGLHMASALALVGLAGSSLVAGMMLGLLALDLSSWHQGTGFSGQSLIAGALLGSMALLPGLACWAAGRKLMRERGDEPLCAPRTAALVAICLAFVGGLVGHTLGFPA